jgi:hypothetical protein
MDSCHRWGHLQERTKNYRSGTVLLPLNRALRSLMLLAPGAAFQKGRNAAVAEFVAARTLLHPMICNVYIFI